MTRSGFKNLIMRGNLVELAVAVVTGTQFSNLVKEYLSSFVQPAALPVGGTPNFGNLSFKAGKAAYTYGQFVTVGGVSGHRAAALGYYMAMRRSSRPVTSRKPRRVKLRVPVIITPP